jgi:hypothetical protein
LSNDNLILVSGESATGKSASLMNLRDPESVMYLNCEGKKLPFKSKFKTITITDPLQVTQAIAAAENMPDIKVIIIDTQTFMMDMYESIHVLTSTNTMSAWGQYAQFFRTLMLDTVSKSTKDIVFLAHTLTTYNEDNIQEVKVPVKGALKNNGIESFFTSVISTKKVPLKILDGYKNDMLNITEDEKLLGFKYCFQTKLTKQTVNERIRAPMGMFTRDETYTDNDLQVVLDHLHNYYG